jgi:dTDP-4-amino-4,6-dideoxygalactose transaminase
LSTLKSADNWLLLALIPISLYVFMKLGLYRAVLRYMSSQALWVIVLGRMPQWFKLRGKYANMITFTCSEFECMRVPSVPNYVEHAYYKHYVFVRPELLADGWNRDRIVAEINALGVPCMQGSCSEVYLE